jgi:hypothetical protein
MDTRRCQLVDSRFGVCDLARRREESTNRPHWSTVRIKAENMLGAFGRYNVNELGVKAIQTISDLE